MNKQHSYRYEKVVIGASLESLSFAFMNNLPVIFTELQKPFQFDFFDPSLDLSIFNFKNISTQMSSGEETIEVGSKKVSLYEHLLFVLSLAGQVPFSDKAKILEFDQEDCSLTVVTNGGLTIKVCADEFLVFDENDLSGIEPPSKEVEQRFKEELKKSRADGLSESNQTPGPHRSEFNCLHSSNKMEASLCSTGEQKALLVSIMLSHAILRKKECGSAPILLLDEISAHLDERRRSSLFELLQNLESQIWMTGTESGAFSDILKIAEAYNISEGKIV